MKRKLSVLMVLISFFTFTVDSYTVKADFIFDFFEWSVEALKEVGIIYDPTLHPNSLQEVADEINAKDPNANVEATNESIGNYINQNTTINNTDNSKTYNENVKNIINYEINSLLDEQAYIYSYDGGSTAEYFSSAIFYVRLMSFLREYQDEYYCLCVLRADSKGQIWCINKERYPYLCMVDENVFRYPNMIKCMPVDGLTAQRVYAADMYFTWDSSDNTFKTATNKDMDYIPYLTLDPNQGFNLSTSSTAWTRGVIMTTGGVVPFRHFNTLSDITAQSVLYQPYYFNNSVYSNYINTVGDYVVTNDNSNKVDYGDITSYIDSFNNENGYPPNPSQIEIHIHNESNPNTPTPTPTPNPDNPSGGVGSGSFVNNNNPSVTNNPTFNNNPNINVTLFPSVSGNTVSGNGTGSEGGIGSIFGWLGDLGQVIGDLIKNLGEAIKNIVIGISDLITSIVTDLPTMFFDFVGAFFGWMPPEWSTLLSLSLAAMLIFGIIKIFRG